MGTLGAGSMESLTLSFGKSAGHDVEASSRLTALATSVVAMGSSALACISPKALKASSNAE